MKTMITAIGESLPIAVGVMISPMPIVALVLMLVSHRARANGTAFVIGWFIGVFVVCALVALLAGSAADRSADAPTWLSWLKIVLGVLLLLLAVKDWRGRPTGDAVATPPKWMASIDSFSPAKAAGLGVLLGAINPKNLLLVVSGGSAIAAATSDSSERIWAAAIFAVVASLGVLVPFVIYLTLGDRATSILTSVKEWMSANNAIIMTVLFLVLGVKVIGDGISGL